MAAAADGLFAEHGLEVELVESPPGSQRVESLSRGAGHFLLTATLYHLQALAGSGPLAVRAVAALHQRSPIAALVARDSHLVGLSDLAGRRLGAPAGRQMGWLGAELQASLRAAGGDAGQADLVDMSYAEAHGALGRGEIDMIANFAELLPIDERRVGTPLRAIPAGVAAYTSAVLAGDAVPGALVDRFVAAAVESFHRQREEPRRGVAELRARYPQVAPEIAVRTWVELQPYVFREADGSVGTMDGARWERTLEWTAQTHGLPPVPIDQVVRAECLGKPPAAVETP